MIALPLPYPSGNGKGRASRQSHTTHLRTVPTNKLLFLTNELAKKAEITILSARKSTRPGFQAGASWVERKPFKRKGIVRDSHLGL